METNVIEDRLREAMALVNEEGRLLAPDVLEKRAEDLFHDVGAGELIDVISSLKLVDGNYARENLGPLVEKLRSEDGHAELRNCVARNEDQIKAVRQMLAVLNRLSSYLDRGIDFKCPGDGIAQILALLFTEMRQPNACGNRVAENDSG